ncbi:ABC transporter ATP-binding protein [Paractinoplanes durhamensis]|uniref:ABC transporter ATP-binding protein n=2 Tax=Paractinoplanes durhamensis TaxID=113563 RepID=A0ABQ3ZC66_9ACTN|nr:ABC transporter ATP-binding protein [Actinoplanes durhamensis]
MTREDAAVTLRGISRSYGRGNAAVRAVDNVTLAFPRGAWTAVMGPSGSGKSTLLHCAAGLERVDEGQVLLGDTDLTAARDRTLTELRRTRIGFVFQSFNLIGSMTAAQNVALPLRLAGQRPSAAVVRDTLASVGLADRARHRPRELSGGQQQRVALARAMVTRPDVLFADEPTGALDSTSAAVVLDMMRQMASNGQSIVMVTHDPLAAARADAVIFLRDGRVVDRLAGASAGQVAARLTALEVGP